MDNADQPVALSYGSHSSTKSIC